MQKDPQTLEQVYPRMSLPQQNMNCRITSMMCALFSTLAPSLQAEEDALWHTDFSAAKRIALKQNKDLLIHFETSDWCGWCIKLNKEVLGKTAFREEITEDYILVQVDFPRRKKLPPGIAEQNAALKKKYCVMTYPTILLCDAEGRPYARTQYKEGGDVSYLHHLAMLRANKNKRDLALTEAKSLAGKEKARMLEKALSHVPCTALSLYQKTLDDIRTSDPDDLSGFYNAYLIQKTTTELRQAISSCMAKGNHQGLIPEVDHYIRENKLVGEPLQTALEFKLDTYLSTKNHKEALKCADQIISINDINLRGRYASMVKKRVLRTQEQK